MQLNDHPIYNAFPVPPLALWGSWPVSSSCVYPPKARGTAFIAYLSHFYAPLTFPHPPFYSRLCVATAMQCNLKYYALTASHISYFLPWEFSMAPTWVSAGIHSPFWGKLNQEVWASPWSKRRGRSMDKYTLIQWLRWMILRTTLHGSSESPQ